jgi:hypothetical protein
VLRFGLELWAIGGLCRTPGGLEDGFAKLAVPTELELPPLLTGPPSNEEAEALVEAFADNGVTFVGPPLQCCSRRRLR